MNITTVKFDDIPLKLSEMLQEKGINYDEKNKSLSIENIKTPIVPRVGDYFSYITNGILLNGEVVYVNIIVRDKSSDSEIYIVVKIDEDDFYVDE